MWIGDAKMDQIGDEVAKAAFTLIQKRVAALAADAENS